MYDVDGGSKNGSEVLCVLCVQRLFHSLDKPVHLDFRQFDRATVVSFLRYLYTGTIPHQNGMNSVTMLAMRYMHTPTSYGV